MGTDNSSTLLEGTSIHSSGGRSVHSEKDIQLLRPLWEARFNDFIYYYRINFWHFLLSSFQSCLAKGSPGIMHFGLYILNTSFGATLPWPYHVSSGTAGGATMEPGNERSGCFLSL